MGKIIILHPVEVTKRSAWIKLSDNQQIVIDTLLEGINPILATGTSQKYFCLQFEGWRIFFHRRLSQAEE